MALNKQLLSDTLQYIRKNRASWNQDFWHVGVGGFLNYRGEASDSENPLPPVEEQCGTIACFAGHACALAGAAFKASPGLVEDKLIGMIGTDGIYGNRRSERLEVLKGFGITEADVRAIAEKRADAETQDVLTPKGEFKSVRNHAQDVLGLTDTQADALFAPSNDFARLCKLVKALLAGKDIREDTYNTYGVVVGSREYNEAYDLGNIDNY